MGQLLGNAVRFGHAVDVLVAGEGIETMLSVRQILPTLPMAAALSANHLAALILPPRSVGSISLTMPTLPVIGRRKRWPNARSPWGSKSFH